MYRVFSFWSYILQMLSRILHDLVAVVGLYLVYLTYAMQEATEGVWINRIERLWVTLDDRKKSIGQTTTLLFCRVAERVAKMFDRVFGPQIFSAQTIGVSSSLSFASLFLILGIALEAGCYLVTQHADVVKPELLRGMPLLILLGLFFLGIALACGSIVLLPILLSGRFWVWMSCVPVALVLTGIARLLREGRLHGITLGLAGALVASFLSDILLLMVVRQSLRWGLQHTSLRRLLFVLLIQGFTLFLVFIVPFRLPVEWYPRLAKSATGQSVFWISIFNLPTAVASLAFSLSMIVVLSHRLFWPLISEFTFVLTRNDILEKRKTVRWIGLALLGYGVSSQIPLLRFLADKVLK